MDIQERDFRRLVTAVQDDAEYQEILKIANEAYRRYDMSSPKWDDDYSGERLDKVARFLRFVESAGSIKNLENDLWDKAAPTERRKWRDMANNLECFIDVTF